MDDINPVSPVLENSTSCSEVVRVPHLWTHVSGHQQWGMEMGLMVSQEMEEIHGIKPTAHYSKRNPGWFDPMKVGLNHII